MEDKILLVDDEPDIVSLLEEVLNREGFLNIKKAYTGKCALELCKTFEPDIIVLDIMLPDMDGIEVCRKIREFSICPILFLSSRNDDMDKILGLACGGDDYVTKPFSPREIVYRMKAQLRRMQYVRTEVNTKGYIAERKQLKCGNLTIDVDASIAYKDGKPLELTAKEYGMLLFFMENPNKIISKERIYERVWGEESVVCDNTIMVHIRHLREKIEVDASEPKRLLTVKGLGYKFLDGDSI
ncbi:MAG: response regulator transcription factor [Coprococcus sp.]